MSAVTADNEPLLSPEADDFIASDEIRELLTRFVRSRVSAADVEDVVQTILFAAIASDSRPTEHEEQRRWVIGVARHKVADLHRKAGRAHEVELPEQLSSSTHADEPEADARDLVRWAGKQTEGDAEAQRTLDWMAREGRGEKLAHIAEDEDLPAAQVRQRVSRLRRLLKQRWLRDLAAVAALAALALVAWRLMRSPERPIAPRPDPDLAPLQPDGRTRRGRELRAEALKACEDSKWQPCLDGLDRAAQLDPKGDSLETIAAARARARKALDEQQSSPPPTATNAPVAPPVKAPLAPPVKAPRPRQQRKTKPRPVQKNKWEPPQKGYQKGSTNKKGKQRIDGDKPLFPPQQKKL